MVALGLLLLIPVTMWLGQTVLLCVAGLPLRWRVSAADLPRSLKRVNRVLTNAALLAALWVYPLLRGQAPLSYYARFLPLGPGALALAWGLAAAVLYLTLLYLVWMWSDNIRFEVRHGAARLVRRLAGVPLTAAVVALVEELLFRGMLLAELLETWPRPAALAAGIVVFAGAHYVRSVKRYWTFPGHLALGTLFCLAFVGTQTLWLSLGLHAGGVLVLLAVRPFLRCTGPAWLVGASIFPYAGVVGVVALLLLCANVYLRLGGAS